MMTDKKQWSIKSIIGKLRKPGMVSTLVRGSGVVFISKGLGVGFGFFLQLLLARWMGASQYGFYVYILSWATLGAMIAGLGFGPGLLRFVPEYKTIQDESRLKGVLQGSLGISIVASVAIALIATGGVLWHSTRNPIENLPAIIIGLWIIPFLTINTLSMSMLRGIRKMTAAYIPSQVLRPAIILLGAFVVFSTQQNQSLDSAFVLAMTIVALVVVELFAGWQIHKHLPIGTSSVKATYELRSWLRVSFPLLMIGGFVKIIKQTDILMIGMLLTSADVGFYNAAAKTSNLAAFALSSVNGIAAPMIASTYAEGDSEKLQKLMLRITQLVLVPSALMTVGVIAFSGVVLGTFGEDFLQAQAALIVLTIAQFIRATTGPVGYLLELTGHQDESARVRGVSSTLNIFLNLIGINLFHQMFDNGILGAAVATAISIVVERIWIDALVRKYIKVNGSLFSQVRSVFQK